MGSLSPTHILIVVGLFVVMFGAKRLPDAAHSMGRSLRIFKSEIHELSQEQAPGEPEPLPGPRRSTQPVATRPVTDDRPNGAESSSVS